MSKNMTSIACRPETLARLRAQKRGGETYEELLQKMLSMYVAETSAPDETPGVRD